MPRPTNDTLPANRRRTAPGRFAPVRSRLKNEATMIRITSVRKTP
jgi:hypothetical protein